MGEFIRLNPMEIEVTQDNLSSKGINRKLNDIKKGKTLVCCVSRIGDTYRLIDGHHTLAAHYKAGVPEVLAYLAESRRDFLQNPSQTIDSDIQRMNEELQRRYEQSMFYVPRVNGKEIRTIDQLLNGFDDKKY